MRSKLFIPGIAMLALLFTISACDDDDVVGPETDVEMRATIEGEITDFPVLGINALYDDATNQVQITANWEKDLTLDDPTERLFLQFYKDLDAAAYPVTLVEADSFYIDYSRITMNDSAQYVCSNSADCNITLNGWSNGSLAGSFSGNVTRLSDTGLVPSDVITIANGSFAVNPE